MRTEGGEDRGATQFPLLPAHQVELCATCHSGTRNIVPPKWGEGEVVHAPGCPAVAPTSKTIRRETRLNDMETKVLDSLSDESRTVKHIAETLGVGETTVRKAIKTLEATGAAIKNGTGWKHGAATPAPPAPKKRTAAPTGESARKHDEAQGRDARVLAALAKHPEGLTREQLTAESGAGGLTYMSLWRLHKAGKVRKVVGGARQPTWFAV